MTNEHENKKDVFTEELEAAAIEEALDQIIDGRMSFRVGDKIFIVREPTEVEKFESEIIGENHIHNLKENGEIKLYDSELVPVMVRQKCERLGIDYALMSERAELLQKLLNHVRDMNKEKLAEKMGTEFEGAMWLMSVRKDCYTNDELHNLEKIEAIEAMVSKFQLKTWEHYGDRAKSLYLMACTISLFEDDKDEKPIFEFAEEETRFGKFPIVKSLIEGWKIIPEEFSLITEKFKIFEKGVNPNFLSELSGIVTAGDLSGTLVKTAESSPSEETSQDGQPTS